MTYKSEIHHRRSIRLRNYDYSQAGAYFVTVCAWNRECLFREIKNGDTFLNELGDIVMKCWDLIPTHFPHVEIDEFVVMPNHIHGIVILSNVGAQFIAPFRKTTTEYQGVMNHAPTVGKIVRAFKARCTHMINNVRNTPGGPLWQRNYYEHIIRDESELHRIREYIRDNPVKWHEDEENPNMKRTI
jgi:putative transposase